MESFTFTSMPQSMSSGRARVPSVWSVVLRTSITTVVSRSVVITRSSDSRSSGDIAPSADSIAWRSCSSLAVVRISVRRCFCASTSSKAERRTSSGFGSNIPQPESVSAPASPSAAIVVVFLMTVLSPRAWPTAGRPLTARPA